MHNTCSEWLQQNIYYPPLCAWSSFYLVKSLRNERAWLTMALFKGFQKTVNWLTETALLRRNKRSFHITKALSFWLFFKNYVYHASLISFFTSQDNEVWSPIQAQMTIQTRSKTKTDSPTFTESAQIGNKHSLKKMKHTSRNVYQRFDWLATPNMQWGLTIFLHSEKILWRQSCLGHW